MNKIVYISIFLLILIVFYIIIIIKNLKNSLTVSYSVSKIDLRNIISKNSIDLDIDVKFDNKSDSAISLKNIKADIYYNNVKITAIKKNYLRIYKGITFNKLQTTVFLNKQSGSFGAAVLAKEKVNLKIKLKTKLFFIPVSFSKDIVYNFKDNEW